MISESDLVWTGFGPTKLQITAEHLPVDTVKPPTPWAVFFVLAAVALSCFWFHHQQVPLLMTLYLEYWLDLLNK
jgi:hypothetical protein